MRIKIERDGQAWLLDVRMGLETLTAELRAYNNGPAPETSNPNGTRVAAQFWRADGSGTMKREDVPTEGLAAAVRWEVAQRTYVMGVGEDPQ